MGLGGLRDVPHHTCVALVRADTRRITWPCRILSQRVLVPLLQFQKRRGEIGPNSNVIRIEIERPLVFLFPHPAIVQLLRLHRILIGLSLSFRSAASYFLTVPHVWSTHRVARRTPRVNAHFGVLRPEVTTVEGAWLRPVPPVPGEPLTTM